MNQSAINKHYFCPGEAHPISRSVHLARMAEFYPQCRECPLNADTGQLSATIVQQLKKSQRRKIEPVLFQEENIRGVYLNEFNRALASQITTAFAQLLWEHVTTTPAATVNEPKASAGAMQTVLRQRPSLVVGYDERLSSPDIVSGVVMGLRKMGCQIMDIGLSTAPCFRFATHHLSASAGIYVTGAGSAPSWSGLDLVLAHSQPIAAQSTNPNEITLKAIETRLHQPTNRPTRQPGDHRHFQAIAPYEAGFRKYFHALRPLKVCWATDSNLLKKMFLRLSGDLPCKLVAVEIPQRLRNVTNPEDSDVVRLKDAVKAEAAHLGILIDSDGSRCSFIDDKGQSVPVPQFISLLANYYRDEHSNCVLALSEQLVGQLDQSDYHPGIQQVKASDSPADLTRTMRKYSADIGVLADGRSWLKETVPVCDAMLVLGKVLQALSQSDAPFSSVLLQHTAVKSAA